jgi:lipopolysaccharide transport system ATP-binding protein
MGGAVRLEGVSKRFVLQHHKARSFQELVVNLAHRRNGSREEFWALRDVSLSVAPGETLGIIGENGSGKSTLLKLISGILEPTAGRVRVEGKVSALIELGAGFHPDLTGRENIYLNGAILGLGRREMARRFDEIVAFAELERFIDTPVKHYSSGMYMRLGFAVAISVDPDILIVDEVLTVGDEAFQRKCLERIADLRRRGTTVIFVSHVLGLVERLCDRAVWLERGVIRAQGDARAVVRDYLTAVKPVTVGRAHMDLPSIDSTVGETATIDEPQPRRPAVLSVRLCDADGWERYNFWTGETIVAHVRYRIDNAERKYEIGIRIQRKDGLLIHQSWHLLRKHPKDDKDDGGWINIEIVNLPLDSGTYEITALIRPTDKLPSSWQDNVFLSSTFSIWSRANVSKVATIVTYGT